MGGFIAKQIELYYLLAMLMCICIFINLQSLQGCHPPNENVSGSFSPNIFFTFEQ